MVLNKEIRPIHPLFIIIIIIINNLSSFSIFSLMLVGTYIQFVAGELITHTIYVNFIIDINPLNSVQTWNEIAIPPKDNVNFDLGGAMCDVAYVISQHRWAKFISWTCMLAFLINLFHPPTDMRKKIEQTRLFSFGRATSLGEGKKT